MGCRLAWLQAVTFPVEEGEHGQSASPVHSRTAHAAGWCTESRSRVCPSRQGVEQPSLALPAGAWGNFAQTGFSSASLGEAHKYLCEKIKRRGKKAF